MADLLAELFTLESDFKPDRDKQLAGLYTILDNPAVGQLFVLRIDGTVAGMANALYTVSTAEGRQVVLLEDVIINAAWRGHGFGRQLVEHVLAWAAASGLPASPCLPTATTSVRWPSTPISALKSRRCGCSGRERGRLSRIPTRRRKRLLPEQRQFGPP